MREKLSKLRSAYRKYGLFGFLRRLRTLAAARYADLLSFEVLLHPRRYRRLLRQMLSGDLERIVLWRSSFGFQVPLFQRPQHIAQGLARRRTLVIYEADRATDGCRTLRKQQDGLWLFNFHNLPLRLLLMRELRRTALPRYVQFYSTDWRLSVRDLERFRAKGCKLIYEYVDHLSPALSGTGSLPKNVREKYAYAMAHPEVLVVATAKRLETDVIARRGGDNLVLSGNGVDCAFFQRWENYPFEPVFQRILDRGKPVVCYYGALACWFDYGLVKAVAATGRYSVVLIGLKYDDSFDRSLHGESGIYFLGPRDYRVLKYYAKAADVLIIPFLVNELTRATCPVKLFEYMALGKPIVTTDLDECRAFGSVLIGRSRAEFLQNLERALTLRDDPGYLALLERESRENDWSNKAGLIVGQLQRLEKN